MEASDVAFTYESYIYFELLFAVSQTSTTLFYYREICKRYCPNFFW